MGRQTGQSGDRRALNLRLSELTDAIARKSFGKRGFATSEILTGWADIVGDALASLSLPENCPFRAARGMGGRCLSALTGRRLWNFSISNRY